MRVNNRKWISRVFVMLFMVIATIGIAYAETPENYTEGYYTYTLDADGNATITEYLGNEENIVVPSMLGGHKVVEINAGKDATTAVFMNLKNNVVKTITIPDGVTTLEEAAFADNPNLVTVNLPSSIQNFGLWMFNGDSSLENIFVSNDTESVYDINGVLYVNTEFGITLAAYPSNKSSVTFAIPEDVECISNGAFDRCSYLRKIIFSSNNMKLIMRAFEHATLNPVSIYLNS